jgi:hypothetical protein
LDTPTANFDIFSQNLQANARKIGWAHVITSVHFVDCLLVFEGSKTELQTASLNKSTDLLQIFWNLLHIVAYQYKPT